MSSYCPQCGNLVVEGAAHCTQCGTPLGPADAPTTVLPVAPPMASMAPPAGPPLGGTPPPGYPAAGAVPPTGPPPGGTPPPGYAGDQPPRSNTALIVAVAVLATLLVVGIVAVILTRGGDDDTPATTTAPVTTPTTVATTTSTSTTSTTTSTTSTTTTTAPPATSAPLGDVTAQPAGLFCRDLESKGFSYSAAVDYWRFNGQPNQMDADRNGIPCETVYPRSDVIAYWGSDPGDYFTDVPAGLKCADLADRGFSYPEAVAYWFATGAPDLMDADRNGIPCETVYSQGEVDAYWYGD